MLKNILFLFVLILSGTVTMAQLSNVSVRVIHNGSIPVPGATVSLERKKDNVKSTPAVTDSAGTVRFELATGELYFLDISAKGFTVFTGMLQPDSAIQSFTYTLIAGQKLKEATIISSRPLMRQEDDKTIVDPEALANSAT